MIMFELQQQEFLHKLVGSETLCAKLKSGETLNVGYTRKNTIKQNDERPLHLLNVLTYVTPAT